MPQKKKKKTKKHSTGGKNQCANKLFILREPGYNGHIRTDWKRQKEVLSEEESDGFCQDTEK